MNYLSKALAIANRHAAADAALAYAKALEHVASLQNLVHALHSKGEAASFELIQSLDNAIDAATNANIFLRSLVQDIAKNPHFNKDT